MSEDEHSDEEKDIIEEDDNSKQRGNGTSESEDSDFAWISRSTLGNANVPKLGKQQVTGKQVGGEKKGQSQKLSDCNGSNMDLLEDIDVNKIGN